MTQFQLHSLMQPLYTTLEEVATRGDGQTVMLGVANPHSLQWRSLKLQASWSVSSGVGGQSGHREVEWSGQLDPGFGTTVEFNIGPLTAENLHTITIADVRSRWAGRVAN